MATIQEIVEANREMEWKKQGVPDACIAHSRLSGMDPRDVRAMQEFSSRGFLIVVRCPKTTARAWHGKVPPKRWASKAKTGSSGVIVAPGEPFQVSDYDLMSIWRSTGRGFEKVFTSAANGAVRGKWLPEATAIVVSLNNLLVSRIQHGCQDDFENIQNPGVKAADHFASFCLGHADHQASPAECRDFYKTHGLHWPYREDGSYILPKA